MQRGHFNYLCLFFRQRTHIGRAGWKVLVFVLLAQTANAQQNNHLPSPSASTFPPCTRAKSERPSSSVAMGSLLGKEERRRQKKGIWGRRRARCRPRPHAQTAMKLPSSCFYCLSVLRSEPESSRREKKGVSGDEGSNEGSREGGFRFQDMAWGEPGQSVPREGRKPRGAKWLRE